MSSDRLGINQNARLDEAREMALGTARRLALGAVGYAEHLWQKEDTKSMRAKKVDKSAFSPFGSLPQAARQLIEHSKRLSITLDKLAEGGHVEEAIAGFDALHSLLNAAYRAGSEGPANDEAFEEARKSIAEPAQRARKAIASPKITERRALIEKMCDQKGWNLRLTDSLYGKIQKELETHGITASTSAIRDDIREIKNKK